jgi:iron complex transport system substrate-binding protein
MFGYFPKRFALRLIFLLLCAGVALLSAQTKRSVTDLSGRTVSIPSSVTRVAANGALAQMVLMLGGEDRLVATGSFVTRNPMLVKIYPGVRSVPAIFGPPGEKTSVNLELLMKARPDVVLGQDESIEALGIPTVAVSLLDFDDIRKTISLIGEVLGGDAQKRATAFCNYYDSTIQYMSSRTAAIPESKRPKVFYASGDDALSTEGTKSISDSWIRAAGGVNVAAKSGVEAHRNVSLEEIMRWDPDVIIANSFRGFEKIKSTPAWAPLRAVRNHRVYLAPKGVYLWPVRSAEGVLQIPWTALLLHPSLFKSVNIRVVTRNFYKRFYGYALSDAETDRILHPTE